MGRSDKKGPASTLPAPATSPAATPSPQKPTPTPREGVSIPRTTTDNPWRDLHPTRVWPD